MKSVVIYCASSQEIGQLYLDAAAGLAQLLSRNHISVITGPGKQGLKGVINNTILQHEGYVTGVIPQFMVDSGWCHPNLSELVVTHTMHERKSYMAQMSDAAIALPGGFGTLEELMEILTWKQLGLYRNPIIILNINVFYNPLLQFFDNMIAGKFLKSEHQESYQVAKTAEEVLEILQKNEKQIPLISKYDRKVL